MEEIVLQHTFRDQSTLQQHFKLMKSTFKVIICPLQEAQHPTSSFYRLGAPR